MKKWLSVLGAGVVLAGILLVGCGGGVPPEQVSKLQADMGKAQSDIGAVGGKADAAQKAANDLKTSVDTTQKAVNDLKTSVDAAQKDIKDLKAQVGNLALISAYGVWYDAYYQRGNYTFPDVATFNNKLGALIKTSGDKATIEAWDKYLATDKTLNDYVKPLPTDYTKWTADQTAKWTELSGKRTEAFGNAGLAIYNAITK